MRFEDAATLDEAVAFGAAEARAAVTKALDAMIEDAIARGQSLNEVADLIEEQRAPCARAAIEDGIEDIRQRIVRAWPWK